jgi:Transcription initiation factor IID, 18kD subunit
MDDDNDGKHQGMRKKQKDSFTEDIAKLLFAFGDSKDPKAETVKVTEEYLLFFIDKLVAHILEKNARKEGNNMRINKEDVILAIRNDAKWISRVAYIIQRKNEIDEVNRSTKEKHDHRDAAAN